MQLKKIHITRIARQKREARQVNDLCIRIATRHDLPVLLALQEELAVSPEEQMSPEMSENIFQRIASYPDYKIYVAETDDRIVGSFSLLIMDNLAHQGAPSGIIEDLIVDQNFRGAGIGRMLMEYAMEKCRASGCYKMVLSSNRGRRETHAFYVHLGFEQHGYSFVVNLRSFTS